MAVHRCVSSFLRLQCASSQPLTAFTRSCSDAPSKTSKVLATGKPLHRSPWMTDRAVSEEDKEKLVKTILSKGGDNFHTQPVGVLLSVLKSFPERLREKHKEFLKSLTACSPWLHYDSYLDRVAVYSLLHEARVLSREQHVQFMEQLSEYLAGKDATYVSTYLRFLRHSRIPGAFVNPWVLIQDCLKRDEFEVGFIEAINYAFYTNQIYIKEVAQMLDALDVDKVPLSSVAPILHRITHGLKRVKMIGYASRAVRKFRPVVEKNLDLFSAKELSFILMALCYKSPPLDWLKMLIGAILKKKKEDVTPSLICSIMYSISKGMSAEKGGAFDYVTQAGIFLDACSSVPFDASSLSQSDIMLICRALTRLKICHAPYLFAIADEFVENTWKLTALSDFNLGVVLNAVGVLNFKHPELISAVHGLLESGKIDGRKLFPGAKVEMAWVCALRQHYPKSLLHSLWTMPTAEILPRLSDHQTKDLLHLAALIMEVDEVHVQKPKAEWLAALGVGLDEKKTLMTSRRLQDKCLATLENLLPHPSFLARDISNIHQVRFAAALILDENSWPMSWNDSKLKPATLSQAQLSSYGHKAIAIVPLDRDDTLFDGMRSPTGRTALMLESLKRAGWHVVTLDLHNENWSEGSRSAVIMRKKLQEVGVELPSQSPVSLLPGEEINNEE